MTDLIESICLIVSHVVPSKVISEDSELVGRWEGVRV